MSGKSSYNFEIHRLVSDADVEYFSGINESIAGEWHAATHRNIDDQNSEQAVTIPRVSIVSQQSLRALESHGALWKRESEEAAYRVIFSDSDAGSDEPLTLHTRGVVYDEQPGRDPRLVAVFDDPNGQVQAEREYYYGRMIKAERYQGFASRYQDVSIAIGAVSLEAATVTLLDRVAAALPAVITLDAVSTTSPELYARIRAEKRVAREREKQYERDVKQREAERRAAAASVPVRTLPSTRMPIPNGLVRPTPRPTDS